MMQDDPDWTPRPPPTTATGIGTASSPDSPRFTGEGKRPGLEPTIKAKIAFGMVALVVVTLGLVALKSRWSEASSKETGPALTARQDTISDRKARNFEAETPTLAAKPPIVLPAAPAVSAMSLDPSALALPKSFFDAPPPALPPKPMMVGEASQRVAAAGPVGTVHAPAPVVAPSGAVASASPTSVSSPQPETVEAQALRARERQGPEVTATTQVSAAQLGRRSYVLAKGAFIPCVLETQLVSNVFGMTSCVVTQNVYSDDGKMLLVERGSKVSGNYGSNLRNGDSRLAVIWDRIKTPHGITVDVNSPGSDGVGAMGLAGVVDMHWYKRIGAAVMLSLMQDAVQYATAAAAYDNYLRQQREQGTTQAQAPVFTAGNTTKQGNSIAEQVLASSINATPTLYKNRGDVVFVYVAHDIWFDRVYGLQP